MAKISAKKSNLKTIANKIIVSPSTAAVSDLKFKRKKDFSTFLKWIESSNKALARIKLPSKKEIEKLGGGGGGFPWLLALLGLGGLGAFAASKMGGDGGIDGIQKALFQDEARIGTNFSGKLPKTFKVPKKKPFKIKKVKVGGSTNKKIKSNTLKKVEKGTKPGKIKIDKGKITSSKNITKAPEIPKKLEVTTKKVLKKNPFKNIKVNKLKGFKGFLKNTFKWGSRGLAVVDAAHTTVDRLQEGQNVTQAVVGASAETTGSWIGFGKGFSLGSTVTAKLASPLLLAPFPGARPLYGLTVLAGGVTTGFLGSNIGRKTFGGLADRFTGVLDKAKAKNDKKSVTEEKKDKNNMFSGDTIIPFPMVTTEIGEKFDLPTINMDAFTNSSSESSVPFSAGLNNDNPFTDLLLTNLK